MMSDRRVVRITDFAKLREADEGALLRYLARPAESSVVIFIADELDKRRKLSKTLLDACVSVEFATLADNELAVWARDQLKKLKTDADERTLRQIIALVGTSVRRLSNEWKAGDPALSTAGTSRWTCWTHSSAIRASTRILSLRTHDRQRPKSPATLRRLLDDDAEPVCSSG